MLKDNNLGLGAQRGTGQGEGTCTGLDVFQGILGRLNGKSETELEKEQRSRDDLKRAIYTERRWGSTRFVSGGLLVGDRIKGLKNQSEEVHNVSDAVENEDESRSKKRKRTKEAKDVIDMDQLGLGSPPHLFEQQPESTQPEGFSIRLVSPEGRIRTSKKAQCRVEKAQRRLEKIQARQAGQRGKGNSNDATSDDPIESQPIEESKARRKIDKARRKLQRRRRRENRHSLMAEGHSKISTEVSDHPLNDTEVAVVKGSPYTLRSPISVPEGSTGGRHAVRQRYIQHKRMAMMDSTALNEVCQAGGPAC